MDLKTIKDLRVKMEVTSIRGVGYGLFSQSIEAIDFLLSEVERLEGEVNELIYKNGGCPACKGYDRLHRNCILR